MLGTRDFLGPEPPTWNLGFLGYHHLHLMRLGAYLLLEVHLLVTLQVVRPLVVHQAVPPLVVHQAVRPLVIHRPGKQEQGGTAETFRTSNQWPVAEQCLEPPVECFTCVHLLCVTSTVIHCTVNVYNVYFALYVTLQCCNY